MQMPPGSAKLSSRDVHPIPVNLLALDHHVAEVNADAKLHPPLGREARVLSFESGLNIDGAVHCLDHACEFGEHTVAGGVDEPPVMLPDLRID
jgi:hypothetical protein